MAICASSIGPNCASSCPPCLPRCPSARLLEGYDEPSSRVEPDDDRDMERSLACFATQPRQRAGTTAAEELRAIRVYDRRCRRRELVAGAGAARGRRRWPNARRSRGTLTPRRQPTPAAMAAQGNPCDHRGPPRPVARPPIFKRIAALLSANRHVRLAASPTIPHTAAALTRARRCLRSNCRD